MDEFSGPMSRQEDGEGVSRKGSATFTSPWAASKVPTSGNAEAKNEAASMKLLQDQHGATVWYIGASTRTTAEDAMANGARTSGFVFVSYAHADLDRVKKLLDYLQSHNFVVWCG